MKKGQKVDNCYYGIWVHFKSYQYNENSICVTSKSKKYPNFDHLAVKVTNRKKSKLYLLHLDYMYTDELVQRLLTCPKRVVVGLRTVPARGSYTKKEFTLCSEDGQYDFKGFICQNAHLIEDYSCGLVYNPKGERGRFCLLRVNGIHGRNKQIPHHNFGHEHTLSAADINSGITSPKNVVEISGFLTFEQAIQHYTKRINLLETDRRKHFPIPQSSQGNLFDL